MELVTTVKNTCYSVNSDPPPGDVAKWQVEGTETYSSSLYPPVHRKRKLQKTPFALTKVFTSGGAAQRD
jgi:hypothetical protein